MPDRRSKLKLKPDGQWSIEAILQIAEHLDCVVLTNDIRGDTIIIRGFFSEAEIKEKVPNIPDFTIETE